MCILVCVWVWDDIFRFQGQGVFPLSLSIVPAATVIRWEQSSHQDSRPAANGRAGQRGPEVDRNYSVSSFALQFLWRFKVYPLHLHDKDCDHVPRRANSPFIWFSPLISVSSLTEGVCESVGSVALFSVGMKPDRLFVLYGTWLPLPALRDQKPSAWLVQMSLLPSAGISVHNLLNKIPHFKQKKARVCMQQSATLRLTAVALIEMFSQLHGRNLIHTLFNL